MLTYEAKLHYEKVLGPSLIYSPGGRDDSSDDNLETVSSSDRPTMEQTSVLRFHNGTAGEKHDTQMTPPKQQNLFGTQNSKKMNNATQNFYTN